MRKTVLASAVVLVALLVMGLAMARWFETLTIDGTVNTGSVDAAFVEGKCWDNEPDEKDVSNISCLVDEQDPHKLIVTVTNAYPCVEYFCDFYILNTGSIPVKVWTFDVDRGNLPEGATLEIKAPELPYQLEPGEQASCQLYLHLDNSAEENMEYSFSATFDVGQWNEEPK